MASPRIRFIASVPLSGRQWPALDERFVRRGLGTEQQARRVGSLRESGGRVAPVRPLVGHGGADSTRSSSVGGIRYRRSPVQPNTKFATTWCMQRDGGGVTDDNSGDGHVVALGARARRRAPANVAPADPAQSAAIALLTTEERAALNLAASDDPPPRSGSMLIAAASGLAKLAAAHVAQCLSADTDVRELTRKDRLALAFAPRLSAEVHRAAPMETPAAGGCDPILALLEGSQDEDTGHLVVGARIDLGSRRTDPSDEF